MTYDRQNLAVLITVDTEVWCDGWRNIDAKFSGAFTKYIYGSTRNGDYGLPFQLKILNEYGLKAVFFVEPLFALRFGMSPLQEIIGLIQETGQRVELHLHTEWVDESRTPVFPDIREKRQHITNFALDEQEQLIRKGIELLLSAGANDLHAFRAGSFAASNQTLQALAKTPIRIDSSLNPVAPPCEIESGKKQIQVHEINGVLEVPMTVFQDGVGRRRHAQLAACSFAEIKSALNAAYRIGWAHFVLLSHSFELLNSRRTSRDPIVVRRFLKLCKYLARNANRFSTIDFSSESLISYPGTPSPLRVGIGDTVGRYAGQILSRLS